MSNVFKVKDDDNRFLIAIKKYFEISEFYDLTIVKCKLCDQTLTVTGQMFPVRALVLQHLIQHLKDPQIYKKIIGEAKCFNDRLQNNEFIADENDYESLK
jgi:hypothetical protein